MAIHSDGVYVLLGFDFNIHFDDKMISVEKWDEERPMSVIYFDGEKEEWFVKRFLPEASTKPVSFISEHESSRMAFATSLYHPQAIIKYNKRFKHTRDREDDVVDVKKFIAVKGLKAIGNKLSNLPLTDVLLASPNVELEEATALEISEARKLDDALEVQSEISQPETEEKTVEETAIIESKPEDDLPEPPVSDDGQASLF